MKLLALLVFLVVVSTAPIRNLTVAAALGVVIFLVTLSAGLPVFAVILRAGFVLPVTGMLAAVTWLSGDPPRAVAVLTKSYVSALAVLVLIGSTPMPRLLAGMERLGVPRLLLTTAHFLYRYLFVIGDQARRMDLAAQCRGGPGLRRRFAAAAGTLAVLFGRSYARAESIHRSMMARGFDGTIRLSRAPQPVAADYVFLASSAAVLVAVRVAACL